MRPVAKPFRARLRHQRRPAAPPMAPGPARRHGAPASERVRPAARRHRHPMRIRRPEPLHASSLGQGRIISWPMAARSQALACSLRTRGWLGFWNYSSDAIHAALLLRALIEQWTDRRRCNDEKHHDCENAPLLRDIPTHEWFDSRASNCEREHPGLKRLRGWPTLSVVLGCLLREQFGRNNDARTWCDELHRSFDCHPLARGRANRLRRHGA